MGDAESLHGVIIPTTPWTLLTSLRPHDHQVTPGAALLMRIIEDFIHLIGEAQKPFQSFLVVTSNLSKHHTTLPHDKEWQSDKNKKADTIHIILQIRSECELHGFTVVHPQLSSPEIFISKSHFQMIYFICSDIMAVVFWLHVISLLLLQWLPSSESRCQQFPVISISPWRAGEVWRTGPELQRTSSTSQKRSLSPQLKVSKINMAAK